jgi:threonine dehydrogenase-like Zn-dependent dehydrogenase
MPLELLVKSPSVVGFELYQDRDPVGDEVLIQTLVSGIKSGTELNLYRGVVPFAEEVWDPDLRLFRHAAEGETIEPFFPHTLGSWAAGVVRQVGPDVRSLKTGDLVHGEWKHRQTALMLEAALYPIPKQCDAEAMLFADPARFALAAIHDASIKLGDRVAVFGLGAIGMIAVQMARLSGAERVFGVDPIPERLDLARKLGVDTTFNPTRCDVGLAIKEATRGAGVDVAVEVSGMYAALQQALRCVHTEGLVVAASYYADARGRVDLSREWHHNRITLRSSMPVWGCTHRHHPMWDLSRLQGVAIRLLEEHRLTVKPLIGARFRFEEAAKAYEMLGGSPGAAVKVLLIYGDDDGLNSVRERG